MTDYTEHDLEMALGFAANGPAYGGADEYHVVLAAEVVRLREALSASDAAHDAAHASLVRLADKHRAQAEMAGALMHTIDTADHEFWLHAVLEAARPVRAWCVLPSPTPAEEP